MKKQGKKLLLTGSSLVLSGSLALGAGADKTGAVAQENAHSLDGVKKIECQTNDDLLLKDVLPKDILETTSEKLQHLTVKEAVNIAKYNLTPKTALSFDEVDQLKEIYSKYVNGKAEVNSKVTAYWNKDMDSNEPYWNKDM